MTFEKTNTVMWLRRQTTGNIKKKISEKIQAMDGDYLFKNVGNRQKNAMTGSKS